MRKGYVPGAARGRPKPVFTVHVAGCGAHALEVLMGGLLVFAVRPVDMSFGSLVAPLDMCAETSASRLGDTTLGEIHGSARRRKEEKEDP